MTRLAGELADAWAPFLYPWSQLATGVERLREGATRGGHPDRLPEIHPSVPTVVADTDAKAREGAAWFVSFYVTTMGAIYRDSLTRQGYGKAVEAVLAANAPKFTGVVPADAEELLEQLIVYGTPPEARRDDASRRSPMLACSLHRELAAVRPTPARVSLTRCLPTNPELISLRRCNQEHTE